MDGHGCGFFFFARFVFVNELSRKVVYAERSANDGHGGILEEDEVSIAYLGGVVNEGDRKPPRGGEMNFSVTQITRTDSIRQM